MKITKILMLFFVIINTACSQNFHSKIKGEWRCVDVMDCPDFLLFLSNGQYRVFNDCGSQGPGLPLVEKGNWSIDTKEKTIILTNRKYISPYSDFSDYHGKNGKLIFYVKNISENNMALCFSKDDNDCVTENYVRNEQYTKISELFSGMGNITKEFSLKDYKSILKLTYDFYKEPGQLIVKDQMGNILFETKMSETEEEQIKEIELSNTYIDKLFFKIKTEKSNSKWKLKVELE